MRRCRLGGERGLDDVSADMDWVRYAVDGRGDAVAVWEEYKWPRSVRSAVLDAAAPRVESLTVRARAKVGRRVRMTALPADLSPTTLEWRFGDGTSARGRAVRHAYRRAGHYRVRVTATDAAGHATSVSQRLRVMR